MKAVFEKIIERLEEEVSVPKMERMQERVGIKQTQGFCLGVRGAVEIISQAAEEYATAINVGNNDSTKINQEPKTRIECLRSMSVEELADRIPVSSASVEIDFCQNISECDDITTHGGAIPDEMCKKCLIQWLNSPE